MGVIRDPAVTKNLLLEREARAVPSKAQLHLVLREAVPLVPKGVKVQAIRVVTGKVSQEAVAVLAGAEARADGTAHEAEPVDRADGRPGVLLTLEGDVGAGAAISRVIGGNSLVVVDHELCDLAVLTEVLRLMYMG